MKNDPSTFQSTLIFNASSFTSLEIDCNEVKNKSLWKKYQQRIKSSDEIAIELEKKELTTNRQSS